MNDSSPDPIARLASRIYREMSGLGPPANGDPGNGHLPTPPEVPAAPAAPEPFPLPRSTALPPSSDPAIAAGVRAFVEQVRALHQGGIGSPAGPVPPGAPGLAGLEGDLVRRLAARMMHEPGLRPVDLASVRQEFPALRQQVHGQPLAWMDNAATTQKPQCVIDAVANYYARDNSNIHRGAHTLAARATEAYEGARDRVRAFLGASSAREILFVRGTTEGINLVAQTFGRKFLQPGDEIVLSHLEHHANIVPWQMIAREKGAVLRVIPVNDRGEVLLEAYEALLGPRTRLVALSQASNSLGTILPVEAMTRTAHRHGARVLIDGAQSVAHMPVNVQQLGCDFFVFSGHKIFAPMGVGAVYVREDLLETLPPWQGGGNMIRDVTFEETTYNDPPARFEAGTPSVADAVGLGAALDFVTRVGLRAIGRHEQELLQRATEGLAAVPGLRLIGTAREKVGVISFVLRDRPTEEVGRLLDQEGIAVRAGHHCSQPALRRFGVESTVRPSFSLYNTAEEVDRLVDAVRRIQRIGTLR